MNPNENKAWPIRPLVRAIAPMTNHGLLKTKARGILLRTIVGSRGAETESMHGPQLWVVAFIHHGGT